jgi:hypothetical protein
MNTNSTDHEYILWDDSLKWENDAPNDYKIMYNGDVVQEIHFQNGPVKECGRNGISEDDLLTIVLTRLYSFQNSEHRCVQNEIAIKALEAAIMALGDRTAKRIEAGTEGTSAV